VQITPAKELLPKDALQGEFGISDTSEFLIPQVYSQPANLLDYLPRKAIILVDDLSILQTLANEVEEEAVKLRRESEQEGVIAKDFPFPYITWSEIQDEIDLTPGAGNGVFNR